MMELTNISPIDGRYYNKTRELSDYTSEYALIKYRVFVEIEWLKYLCKNNVIENSLTIEEEKVLDSINKNFSYEDAEEVKAKERITNHDVKACEYYLQDKLKENGLSKLIPFIHITLTSEDINSTSYALMVKDSINEVYIPKIKELIDNLNSLAVKYKDTPMMGHTHGQNATPTTVGKEFRVFSYRLESILKLITDIKMRAKLSGAVGNYNAHMVAYPEFDWIDLSSSFINSLGIEYNPLTTQIESHDILCVLLSYIKVTNNIIKDLNSDMWLYISKGYFHEKTKSNEVGSSVMPHKVNPINHENSIANTELSNGIIDSLVNNLQVSRMQRDLSDSSKLRNIGVILSHSLISIKETITGLNKIEVNTLFLKEELDNHYEVITEAIQTVLRKNGYDNAYELLKSLSRGREVTKEDITNFINGLAINEEDKNRLLSLTPSNYLGLSSELVTKRLIP